MSEENKPKEEVPKSLGDVVVNAFKELKETSIAFVKAPKALWGINVPYVIEGLVYFGILTILVTFCSQNMNLSDLHSGWIAGFLTGGITFAMLLLGKVSDKIGVRASLIISLLMMVIGRGLTAFSDTVPMGSGLWSPMFYLVMIGILFVIVAYGFYQPAAYAGVKRYTSPQTAAMGYAVIYGLMNLGGFLSGLLSPAIRHAFEKTMPPNGLGAVFWFYTGLTVISVLCTYFLITKKSDKDAVDRVARETEALKTSAKTEDKKEAEEKKDEGKKIDNTILYIFSALEVIAVVIMVMVYQGKINWPIWLAWTLIILFFVCGLSDFLIKRPEHPFRDLKFVFFIFILIFVQTLFAHNWLTIPVYLQRAFDADSIANKYFETLSNINPLLIFFLSPIAAGLTARANAYKMMVIGTLIMAAPTFLLALTPSVPLFLTYIALMSIGEAIWSPRFLQWIAEIAPKGKTGMYMGIGQLPWFLTKMIVAAYSGAFLAKYVPDPSTGLKSSPETMWFIYGLMAMATPVGLWVARKWMSTGIVGDKPNHSA